MWLHEHGLLLLFLFFLSVFSQQSCPCCQTSVPCPANCKTCTFATLPSCECDDVICLDSTSLESPELPKTFTPCSGGNLVSEDIINCTSGSGFMYQCLYDNCGTTFSACTSCNPGYYGPSCSLVCPIFNGTVCSGAGTCSDGPSGTGMCTCNSGRSGTACEYSRVANCNNHGDYSPSAGLCSCDTGYAGPTCNMCAQSYYGYETGCRRCTTSICNNHGICNTTDGSCICSPQYTGPFCGSCALNYYAYPVCQYCVSSQTCNGRGYCDASGNCVCPSSTFKPYCADCLPGYYGPNCTVCPGVGTTCSSVGTCFDGYLGNGTCACRSGYSGVACTDPTIETLSPTNGPTKGGAQLVITGHYFGATGTYLFNGTTYNAILRTDSQLIISTPAGVGKNISIQVVTSGGSVSNAVYFNYNPPKIDVVMTLLAPRVPTLGTNGTGPGGTNSYLTIIGQDFGKNHGVVSFGTSPLSPVPIWSWSDSQILAMIPEGQGLRSVVVTTGGQSSSVGNVFYAPPSIISITNPASPLRTQGGAVITLNGINFGTTINTDISVSIGGRNCEIQFHNHTQVTCAIPEGAGQDQPLILNVASQTTTAKFSYAPPIITKISGCPTDIGSGTSECSLTAPTTIMIEGDNFGATIGTGNLALNVTVNGLICANPIMLTAHTKFNCTLSPSTGFNVPVVVTKAGNKGFSNLLSYANPVIVSVTCKTNCAGQTFNTTAGGSEMEIVVQKSPPTGTNVTVFYGPPNARDRFPCDKPPTGAITGTLIKCTTTKGVGKDLAFTVTYNGTVLSKPDSTNWTYPAPILDDNTLLLVDIPNLARNATQTGQRNTGEDISFLGKNFGGIISLLTVTYGAENYPCSVNSLITNDTMIQCRTSPGNGSGTFTVCTGDGLYQLCATGSDVFKYPTGPGIVSIAGCDPDGASTVNCPTSGKNPDGSQIRLTIRGSLLGEEGVGAVQVGGNPCYGLTHNQSDPDGTVYCDLPAGVGFLQNVIYRISSNSSSLPVPYLSYAVPELFNVTGCTQSGNDTIDCDRGGNTLITLNGRNFGGFGAKVLIGGSPCSSPTHVPGLEHEMLTCITPSGTDLNAAVLVLQYHGKITQESVQLSYAQCQPGTYSNGTSTTCNNCSAGYYTALKAQKVCLPCENGKFTADSGDTQCTPCPSGKFQNETGASECFSCSPGFFSSKTESTSCMACNQGRYARLENATNCEPCDPGKFQNSTGKSFCYECPAGSKSQSEAFECEPCSPGFAQSEPGHGYCYPCSPGYAASNGNRQGSTDCIECPSGQFSSSSLAIACMNCSVGYYSGSSRSLECSPCFPGYYAPITGSTNCSSCLPGFYASRYGMATCETCPEGSYSGNSASSCQTCEVGQYQNKSRSQNCSLCEPGYFSSGLGSIFCSSCRPGRYQPNSGSSTCLSCPVGTHSSENDGSGSSHCDDCTPGRYSQGSLGICTRCGFGQYQNATGASICLDCQVGRFANASELAACYTCAPGKATSSTGSYTCSDCLLGSYSTDGICKECDAGSFQNVTGQSTCISCSAGSYAATKGLTVCTQCSPGRFQASDGMSVCVDCATGTYNPFRGATVCIDCPATQYNDLEGQTACFPCAPGKYNNNNGTTTCEECQPGFYQNNPGGSYCERCVNGTAQPALGQTTCSSCPAGKFASNTSCDACPPGSSQSSDGSDSCDLCGPGFFQPFSGGQSCLLCEPGFYAATYGASVCLSCSPGSYAPIGGLSGCLDCRPGTAQSQGGQSDCPKCPKGLFSSTNSSTACSSCEPGFFSDNDQNSYCTICPPGKSAQNPRQSSCDLCSPGRFAPTNGSSECTLCPKGKYQDDPEATDCKLAPIGSSSGVEGSLQAVQCARKFIAPLPGLSKCIYCDGGDDGFEFTRCICPAGFYAEDQVDYSTVSSIKCIPCPSGANCLAAGSNASHLVTAPGFWRKDQASLEFYRCLLPSDCLGGLNSTCKENRAGPICSLCAEGYSSSSVAGSCKKCPARSQSQAFIVVIILIMMAIAIFVYWMVLRNKVKVVRTKESLLVFDGNDPRNASVVITKELLVDPDLLFKTNIILNFFQITAGVSLGVEIPWPTYYLRFIHTINFVNLDVAPSGSLVCITFFNYYTKLISYTLIPVVLIIGIVVYYLLIYPLFLTHDDTYVENRRNSYRWMVKLSFWTLLVAHPGVSRMVLDFYKCKYVDGTPYLLRDFSQTCYDQLWWKYFPYDVVMLLIYPVGIPLIFFVVMSRYHKEGMLGEIGIRLKMGFLYENYERAYWWFSLANNALMLSMTSLLGFFPDPIQLPLGMTLLILFLIFILVNKPIMRMTDDRLQCFALIELYLLLLIAYILQQTETGTLPQVTDLLLSIFMIVTPLCIFIYYLTAIMAQIRSIQQNFLEWRYSRHRKGSITTKPGTVGWYVYLSHLWKDWSEWRASTRRQKDDYIEKEAAKKKLLKDRGSSRGPEEEIELVEMSGRETNTPLHTNGENRDSGEGVQ